MLNLQVVQHNIRGFTLVETIIYIGLFSIMFTGIFVSIYPFITGAERISKNIATEGEVAFILSKMRYALAANVTTGADRVETPGESETSNELVVKNSGEQLFEFQNTDCSPPLLCKQLSYREKDTDELLPLNAERVSIENFSVTHEFDSDTGIRYLDIEFDANDEHIGPIRYYLHF